MREKCVSDLKLKVRKLDIIKSNLKYILPDAFNSIVFKDFLTTLTIDNDLNNANDPLVFQMLAKGSFKGLTALSSLVITNIPSLNVLDKNATDNLVDSLETLRIFSIANPWSPSSLLSATKFKKLTYVDLRGNHISSLDSSSFSSIADVVKTLILTTSKIESISVDTFSDFKALQSLYLQNNLLKTISAKTFDN